MITKELIIHLEEVHKAMDWLLEKCAILDINFLPSQSLAWDAVKNNHEMIKILKAECCHAYSDRTIPASCIHCGKKI